MSRAGVQIPHGPRKTLSMEYICRFCGKLCKNDNSLKQHEIRCKLNPNRIKIKSNFIKYNEYRKNNNIPGQNQFTKARRIGAAIPTVSESTKEKIRIKRKNYKHSDSSKNKIKIGMRNAVINNPQSYSSQNINGRVKKVYYKNILLDSKWEVLFAQYLDSVNIKWERPNTGIPYIWNNNEHMYFPDFYLPNIIIM